MAFLSSTEYGGKYIKGAGSKMGRKEQLRFTPKLHQPAHQPVPRPIFALCSPCVVYQCRIGDIPILAGLSLAFSFSFVLLALSRLQQSNPPFQAPSVEKLKNVNKSIARDTTGRCHAVLHTQSLIGPMRRETHHFFFNIISSTRI